MNDDEFLFQGGKVIERERAQTILLIEFLQEVERRKLHLKRGYPSLFELRTKHFKYCVGSAQIRINSMRLINDVPEVKEKIASGSVSLTVAAQVQTFIRQERKLEHVYSREQKLDLVEMCESKSTREVERQLAELNPEFGNRESVRAVSAERSRMTMTVSNRLLEKLNKLKAHYAHSNPSMSYEQIYERLVDKELAEIEREPRKRKVSEIRRASEGPLAVLATANAPNAESLNADKKGPQTSNISDTEMSDETKAKANRPESGKMPKSDRELHAERVSKVSMMSSGLKIEDPPLIYDRS